MMPLRAMPCLHRGVTLLELLVVLTLMALIAAMVLPMFSGGVSGTDLKTAAQSVANSSEASTSAQPRICPCCGLGHLIHIRRLPKNPLGP